MLGDVLNHLDDLADLLGSAVEFGDALVAALGQFFGLLVRVFIEFRPLQLIYYLLVMKH